MKNCWWKFKSNVLTIIFRFAVVCHENENFKFVYMDKYFILQIREYQHCLIQIDAALRSHHIHADISTCKFCKMKYWYFLIIRITTRNMVLMDEKVAQLLLRKKTSKSSMVLEITVGSHVVLEMVVVYISLQRLKRLCA
jgi:hypothetical protein